MIRVRNPYTQSARCLGDWYYKFQHGELTKEYVLGWNTKLIWSLCLGSELKTRREEMGIGKGRRWHLVELGLCLAQSTFSNVAFRPSHLWVVKFIAKTYDHRMAQWLDYITHYIFYNIKASKIHLQYESKQQICYAKTA